MLIHTANNDIQMFEHLIDKKSQQVTHLHLVKGQEVPEHLSDKTVVVIPYKGQIKFSTREEYRVIIPGDIVELVPNELHSLIALEDSDLMVVKSDLK